MSTVSVMFRDYSDENSTTTVNVGDLSALDAWSVATGLADALVTHLEAHSLSDAAKVNYGQLTQAIDYLLPASPFAQRELGFRFYIRDNVTQEIGFFTIPCADLAIGSVVAAQDNLNLAAAPTAAFVTWIEANMKSRDGNAVTVERALIVGRNS